MRPDTDRSAGGRRGYGSCGNPFFHDEPCLPDYCTYNTPDSLAWVPRRDCNNSRHGRMEAAEVLRCTDSRELHTNVAPVPKLPELNLPSGVGEVPLVTVCGGPVVGPLHDSICTDCDVIWRKREVLNRNICRARWWTRYNLSTWSRRSCKIDGGYIRATHGLRVVCRTEGKSCSARCYGVAAVIKTGEGVNAAAIGCGRCRACPAQCHGNA